MNSKKYRFIPNLATGCLTDDSAKAYFSRLGIAVFVLGILSTASATLLAILAKTALSSVLSISAVAAAANHLVSIIAIYCVAFPFFNLLIKPLPSVKPFKSRMGFKDGVIGFCICVAAMMTGNYISNVILVWVETFLGATTENPIASAISPADPAVVIVTVIFMVIAAPMLEEILFRKVLCAKLLPLGEGYAIVLSGAIFGLFHGNLYQFAYGFLLGAFFAFIYIKTGKLIYTVIYHMAINLMGSVIGPWILSMIDIDKLTAIIESGSIDPSDPALTSLLILSIYETLMMVAAVVGIVFFFKAKKKNMLALEQGILPPPKKNRLANLFCNVGVAAAITYFVLRMVMSLI